MAVVPRSLAPDAAHRARLRRTIALLAACAVLALTAGCVVSGPTRNSPTRSDHERTDSAQSQGYAATAKKNLDTLRKNIAS